MGRNRVGILTNKECRRIELRYLLDNGYLVKNQTIEFVLRWNDGSSIRIESNWNLEDISIQLHYTSSLTTESINYKIKIVEVPSNLGKGSLLYFLCPISNQKCRILYCAYDSQYYKSMKAYKNRIYYYSQIHSKRHLGLEMSNQLTNQIEALRRQIKKSNYKGKPTKLIDRVLRLERRKQYYDRMNLVELEKVFGNYG